MTAHHDVSLRGLSVHYVTAGEGPPTLLVHGFLVSHKEWLPTLPGLGALSCIAPDLPGFGMSDKRPAGGYPYTREAFAQTLLSLLDHLDIDKAHVVGHSMGGSVALTFAADFPDRVDKLVVIDSACYPFPVPLKGKVPLLPVIGPIVFKRLYRRGLFRDYFDNEVWNGREHDIAQVDSYYEDFNTRQGREAAFEVLKRTVDLGSLEHRIPRIQADTLVIWGDEDRIFPVGLAHRLVREIPTARLELIAGCGHAPNEERPEETARLILGHLQRAG